MEAELNDELRFHFEQQVEMHVHAGLARDEAVRRARLFFGGMDGVKEECRDTVACNSWKRSFRIFATVCACRDFAIVLRTSLPASALAPQIRRQVQSIDPGQPVYGIASMNELLDRSLASRRFSARLVGGFAGLALLLASVGIYGVLAHMVGQRSREIGLRMALGAGRADILRLILHKGIVLGGVGVIAGVILAASTASMMASLLYGVRPRDPAVFLLVPLLLLAVAVLASYLPARRTTKVDPMFALREA